MNSLKIRIKIKIRIKEVITINGIIVGIVIIVLVVSFVSAKGNENREDPNENIENDNKRNDNDQDLFQNKDYEYFKSKEEVKQTLNNVEVLARTLWGEGRNLPDYELEKITLVILNRVQSRKYPDNIKDVCLQRWQFSCWNGLYKDYQKGSNTAKVLNASLNDDDYRRCITIAHNVISNYPHNNDLPGVLHYIKNNNDVLINNGVVAISYASWSLGMEVAYKGEHLFLKEGQGRYVT